MGLSSNTLWHQTKKDGLKGIIKDKCLYLSYSLEDMTSLGYTAKFAYPMVSVCDLPLSETGNYLKKYGDYMIGLSAGDKIDDDEDYQKIIYIMSHIKQYEGPLPKRHYKNYRFYDERELRFVPYYDALKEFGEKPFLWDYEGYKKSHNNSSLLTKDLNVMFDWEDIKYIIVETENEKNEFWKLIENRSGRTDLHIPILTNREVKEDIIGTSHDVRLSEEPSKFAKDADIDEIFEKLMGKSLKK